MCGHLSINQSFVNANKCHLNNGNVFGSHLKYCQDFVQNLVVLMVMVFDNTNCLLRIDPKHSQSLKMIRDSEGC